MKKDAFLEKFGNLVRNAREAKDMNQEQLGDAVGMHKNYIGMIERGERNVSLRKAIPLIQYLDLDIRELFNE